MRDEFFWNQAVRDDYGVLFMVISKILEAHANESVKDEPIRFPDLRYLAYVQFQDRPVTFKEIENTMGLAAPTVAGAIKSLERRGMVNLATDSEDRRVKLVTLTDDGRAVMERQEEYRRFMEDKLIGSLSDEEKTFLKDVLEKVLDNLLEMPLPEKD